LGGVIGSLALETECTTTRAQLLSDQWSLALFDILKRIKKSHAAREGVQAELTQLMLDLHLLIQRYGPVRGPELSALKTMEDSEERRKEEEFDGSARQSKLPEHVRDMNLLAPLFLLHASAPLTERQRSNAICVLSTLSNTYHASLAHARSKDQTELNKQNP
jgi:hypothetical protein